MVIHLITIKKMGEANPPISFVLFKAELQRETPFNIFPKAFGIKI